jgi:hypothetical protein
MVNKIIFILCLLLVGCSKEEPMNPTTNITVSGPFNFDKNIRQQTVVVIGPIREGGRLYVNDAWWVVVDISDNKYLTKEGTARYCLIRKMDLDKVGNAD